MQVGWVKNCFSVSPLKICVHLPWWSDWQSEVQCHQQCSIVQLSFITLMAHLKGSDTLESFLSKVAFERDLRKKTCTCVMKTFAIRIFCVLESYFRKKTFWCVTTLRPVIIVGAELTWTGSLRLSTCPELVQFNCSSVKLSHQCCMHVTQKIILSLCDSRACDYNACTRLQVAE